MNFISQNPYSGKLYAEYSYCSKEEITGLLDSMENAYQVWRYSGTQERKFRLLILSELLRNESKEIGQLISEEMGKPIQEAIAEVIKCATVSDYYASNLDRLVLAKEISLESAKAYQVFAPSGIILGIMPWNFPFWQTIRWAVPALAGGNCTLLKHAPNVPGCSLRLEKLFQDAGFPENTFRQVFASVDDIPGIISHHVVSGVSLTGSDHAGSIVGATAGKEIKKVLLELGSNDPFIVLKDADVKKAADIALKARSLNSGQSCISAKRFIVEADIYEMFKEHLTRNVSGLKLGNPMEDAEIGPLARIDLKEKAEKQLAACIEEGARLVYRSEFESVSKCYFNPCIIEVADMNTTAFREEIFAPVYVLHKVHGIEDAIAVANNSNYGLGASIWTNDDLVFERFVRELEFGMIFRNSMVVSDTRLPFGGVKRSGIGRELGEQGFYEFLNSKVILNLVNLD